MAGHYLEAAIQVLESGGATIPVKVSAVRAIHKSVTFHTVLFDIKAHISFCNGGDDSAITPFAARIVRDLGPFLLVASEDTLTLVLETLAVILEVDDGKWLAPDLAASLAKASLDVWSKNNKGRFSLLRRRCFSLHKFQIPSLSLFSLIS